MTPAISIVTRPTARPVFDESGTPRDPASGDIYYAVGDGLAEARHVFLDGVGAPGLWRDRPAVAIGELGFGTGLNFLATWQAWRRTRASDAARLDYVAIEGAPFTVADLARAHAAFPELAEPAAALRAAWPPPVGGFHRLAFDGGRVSLTLVLADVEAGLAALARPLDAWYLDGFAPGRNPAMWSDAVLREVARLCRPGAAVASFTAAGAVRRGLAAAGFEVARRPGHGAKRHCLAARAPGERPAVDGATPSVAVIGAGVAGLSVARALDGRGLAVRVFDRAGAGAEASGIPAAMIAPRLQKTETPRRTFNALAYLHALRVYGGMPTVWSGRGALTLARDADDAAAQARLVGELGWPTEVMQPLDAAVASQRLGAPAARGGLLHPAAGALDGRQLMTALAVGVEVETAEVARLAAAQQGWRLLDAGGGGIAGVDRVVVAAGPWSGRLLGETAPPIRANRGQASVFAGADGPALGVTFGGYLAPTADGGRVLGATFERLAGPDVDGWRTPRDADHDANRASLAAQLPALAEQLGAPEAAWVGLRATTPDYLPYAGEVADGLYLCAGLGSRGFQAAPLLAELLADDVVGAPAPLPAEVVAALRPGRFSAQASGGRMQAT